MVIVFIKILLLFSELKCTFLYTRNAITIVYVQLNNTLTTSLFNIFNCYPYLLVATCLFAGLTSYCRDRVSSCNIYIYSPTRYTKCFND